jgi:hypothetical protein
VLALLSVVTALAAPGLPQVGVLAPATSLGGIHLGDTRAAVVARWGHGYGACRSCTEPTLYFNLKPFEPQGAGVTFRRGRVIAVFTLWSPPRWRTTKGLVLGDDAARVTEVYGALPRSPCAGYDAYLLPTRRGAVTAIYVAGPTVWGFALTRPSEPLCR